MKFYLIVAKGSKKGMPIQITVDLFMIGSDKMCQLRAQNLAAKHCAIVTRERKVFVRDMNSGQSTLVNDTAIPSGLEWPLHAGDRIAFGNLEFMIQYREKELSRKDMEEWAAKCLDVTSERHLFDEGADEYHVPSNASEAASAIIDKLSVQRGLVMGRLRIGRDGDVTTVRFNDTMLVEDAEIALVRKELGEQLNRPNLRVLLDFKNVMRMSSAAVIMLRDFGKWLKQWGSHMAVCRMRKEMQDVLTIFKGDNIPVFPDKKVGVTAKW
jgi:hypothetical protein